LLKERVDGANFQVGVRLRSGRRRHQAFILSGKGSAWACLPAGPLERQFRRGSRRGIGEEVRTGPSARKGNLSWAGGNSGKPLLVVHMMHEKEKSYTSI
jgi:hypothetical protein